MGEALEDSVPVTNDTKVPDNSHAISEPRRPLQASPTSFNLHHVDNRPLVQTKDSVMNNEHDTIAALTVVQQCLANVSATSAQQTTSPPKDNKHRKPQ